jgi:hypothetical protein
LVSVPTVDTALVPLLSYLVFMPKPSTHCMYAHDQLFHTYGQKVFTDNQMSQIKYNYYISNVSKDYDNAQQNRIAKDSITPQKRQPGQHVA